MTRQDFDVSPDSQRFLFIRAEPDARPTRLDVITNWLPELARRLFFTRSENDVRART